MSSSVRRAPSRPYPAPLTLSEVVIPAEFSISPRTFCQILVIAVLCLTLAGSALQFFKYILGHDYVLGLLPLFDLGADISIPSWYASATLLLCSILLAIIFHVKRRDKDQFSLHWGVLSLIFLYLSVDEAARIHETIGDTLRLKFTGTTHGLVHFTWVIYGAAFVLVVGASYIKFLAHLPVKVRRLFIFAGFIYVGGALGMDMVNGRYADLYGSQNFTYEMMTVAEECLEMTGIVIFIYALMSYMVSQVRAVTVRIDEGNSGGKRAMNGQSE
jgi:hypothetical protein